MSKKEGIDRFLTLYPFLKFSHSLQFTFFSKLHCIVSPGHSNHAFKDSDDEESDDEIAPEEISKNYNETRIDSNFSQVTNLRQRKPAAKTPEVSNLKVNQRKNTPEYDFDDHASVSRGDVKRTLSLMSGGSEDKYKVTAAPVTAAPVTAAPVTVQTIKTIKPAILEVLPNNTRVSFDAGVIDITQFRIENNEGTGFEARL